MEKMFRFGAQDMSYEIMTDSSSNLTQDLLDRYKIKMEMVAAELSTRSLGYLY